MMISIGMSYVMWIVGLVRHTLIAKIVVGGIALFAAWKVNNYFVAQKAVSRVIEASKTEGKKINAKSAETRRQAHSTPGSAARLPCRDC